MLENTRFSVIRISYLSVCRLRCPAARLPAQALSLYPSDSHTRDWSRGVVGCQSSPVIKSTRTSQRGSRNDVCLPPTAHKQCVQCASDDEIYE